jgi:hypothetical protein
MHRRLLLIRDNRIQALLVLHQVALAWILLLLLTWVAWVDQWVV